MTARAWKFGNDIDTDAIIPGRFLILNTEEELAQHAFEGTRDDFASSVQKGDIVIGESNFGCGSSREHAPLALKGAGIKYIVAASFARIFYRNSINVGLIPLICQDAVAIRDGAAVEVTPSKGYLTADGVRYSIEPVPTFFQTIADAGGLIAYGRTITEVPVCTASRR